MPYYIVARRADNTSILGNLDGQASLRVRRPERTKAWQDLTLHPHSARVHHWDLEDSRENIIATKLNPTYKDQ
jgi:hypothetical protein